MRRFTAVLAVAIVSSILITAAAIYFDSEDSRQVRKDLYEKYELDAYWQELLENGISTFHPGRLWPGSLDSDVGSPMPGECVPPSPGDGSAVAETS